MFNLAFLFSFMKINERVQSSAEASGALLTEEAFRLRQPFPARCHGTSERVRENIAVQCCSGMTIGKRAKEEFVHAECQSLQWCSMCSMNER